ncbi:hypothetical protein OUZ56_013872 [Daphnia magna]|uniref:Uncharacterized protein n=1 Tax=Daphnia magna TaxID=35525 RepID=A0ABQ9Z7W1_9CRUS|nr:hypothetical protein OUZ56_013872 [Daphnia magna]
MNHRDKGMELSLGACAALLSAMPIDVYSFIRIYSSFFFSLFSLAFSSESTCAAQSVGGKPSLSVARLMTCRAQSVRQHTNGQNRTVLNATKLRENHTSVSFLSPTPKASQSSPTDGEAKQLYLWMGGDSRLTDSGLHMSVIVCTFQAMSSFIPFLPNF